MSPTLYEPDTFIEMSAGSQEVARKIAIMYHEDIQMELDAIDREFADGNLDGVRRMAHKSRSAYGIMGAKSLVELATSIESKSSQGNNQIAEELKQLRRLSLALDEELVRDFKIQ